MKQAAQSVVKDCVNQGSSNQGGLIGDVGTLLLTENNLLRPKNRYGFLSLAKNRSKTTIQTDMVAGQNKNLVVVVRDYRPSVICGPTWGPPPERSPCNDLLQMLSVKKDRITFTTADPQQPGDIKLPRVIVKGKA